MMAERVVHLAVGLTLVLLAGCTTPALVTDPRLDIDSPRALLWSHPYRVIGIEIYHVPDSIPSALAIDALVETLNETTGKEIASVDHFPLPIESERRRWKEDELNALARSNSRHGLSRGEYGVGATAVLHIYYLRGSYASPAGEVRGFHTDGRIFVFFDSGDPVRTRPTMEDKIERSVLIHEVGHALGLVNCGIPMTRDREDPTSRCHSTNPESVMGSGDFTIGPDATRLLREDLIVHTFDSDDLADLRAFREAEPPRGPPDPPRHNND